MGGLFRFSGPRVLGEVGAFWNLFWGRFLACTLLKFFGPTFRHENGPNNWRATTRHPTVHVGWWAGEIWDRKRNQNWGRELDQTLGSQT